MDLEKLFLTGLRLHLCHNNFVHAAIFVKFLVLWHGNCQQNVNFFGIVPGLQSKSLVIVVALVDRVSFQCTEHKIALMKCQT